MSPEEKNIEIAGDEMKFKLYVVENLGEVKAHVSHLREQNKEQFERIQKLENGPRNAMIGSGAIATAIIGVVKALEAVF